MPLQDKDINRLPWCKKDKVQDDPQLLQAVKNEPTDRYV